MTDSTNTPELAKVRSLYGMWGIGVYWTLLERVGAQVTAKHPEPTVLLSMAALCGEFSCRKQKLVDYLAAIQLLGVCQAVINGDELVITFPNLLELKDNYLKDLQVTGKKLASKEVEEDIHKDIARQKSGRAQKYEDPNQPSLPLPDAPGATATPPTPGLADVGREARRWLGEYCRIFKVERGDDFMPTWGRDMKLVKEMLKVFDFDNLILRANAYIRDNDDFVRKSGWSITMFRSRVNAYGKPGKFVFPERKEAAYRAIVVPPDAQEKH